MTGGFHGYLRPDGRVGVRNHLAVVASVTCANGVVEAVANALPNVKAITHTEGCGRGPKDLILAMRSLTGLGRNPNVGAVLVIGLGCEFIKAPMVASEVSQSKKPVEHLVIQETGGSQRTTARAIEIARRMLDELQHTPRRDAGWADLTVGLDFAGLGDGAAAVVGPVFAGFADWLTREGGTVLIPESVELLGDAIALETRVADPALGERVQSALEAKRALRLEVLGSESKGNAFGNFTTESKFTDRLDYAEPARHPGLILLDSPESDLYAMTGMVASGAQIIVQATELGVPGGHPLAPVIKVSSSSALFELMPDDIDLDAEAVSPGRMSTAIADLVGDVARGETSKAEQTGCEVMALLTQGPAF